MSTVGDRKRFRLHVLIDSLTWGGAETLLADFAVAAQEAGAALSVGYLNQRSAAAGRLHDVGIEPIFVPIRSLLRRRDRALVRRHIAEVAPTLLHTHLGYSDFHGGLAARSLGIPSVATLHVMDRENTPRERAKMRIIAVARRHCASRVIAVSDAVRDHYLATGWDFPGHVVTVHNGIVGQVRTGSGARIREEFGLAEDDLVVAMVSVLRRGKGHEVAARAIGLLAARHPRLRLMVMGEGPDRYEIVNTVRPLGDRVILTGHRDDVMDMLCAADILVHPSLVDAFPTALLEAGAAGVPAVATRVGGIPEIIEAGVTGTLIPAPPTAVDLAMALDPLLRDRDHRRHMGRMARHRFERSFTVEHWFERLLPVYEDAIRTSPTERRRVRAPGREARRCESR